MAESSSDRLRGRLTTVAVFDSFEQENAAEHRRRAEMTPAQRCRELAVLQQRQWGELWTSTPIVRTATWETLPW